MNGPSSEAELTSKRVGLPPWLARRRPLQPKLLVVEGHATKDEIEVRLPLMIGREQGAGLMVAHPLISRQHCVITQRDDQLHIKDFNSANGTYVNGKRVSESVLKPGDKLSVGPLTFVVIYQPSGNMSSRQLAKKLANEVRKRRGEDPLPDRRGQSLKAGSPNGDSDRNDDASAEDDELEIDLETLLAAAEQAAAAAAAEGEGEGECGPAGGNKGDPNGTVLELNEPEPGAGGDEEEEMGLFFTWAAQMATSIRRKQAQQKADATAAGTEGQPLVEVATDKRSGESAPSSRDPRGSATSGSGSGGDERTPHSIPSDLSALTDDEDVLRHAAVGGEAPRSSGDGGSDVGRMLDEDMKKRSGDSSDDELANKTLLAGSMPKTASLLEVTVKLKDQPEDKPAKKPRTAEEAAKPGHAERVYGYLLGQIDRIQQQIVEHYQEAAITTQLVSRLQQDQLDLIREEMDQLHQLTDLLKQELTQQHPTIEFSHNPKASLGSLLVSASDPDDVRIEEAAPQIDASSLNASSLSEHRIEHMHGWMLERMAKMQESNRKAWEKVQSFLRHEGMTPKK